MTSSGRTPLSCALLVVAAATLLTGCGGTGHGQAQAAPTIGPAPTITDPSQISLPTDSYMATVEQISQLLNAQNAATASCMRDFGFPSPGGDPVVNGLANMPRYRLTRSYLYGFFDPSIAATKGYDAVQPPAAAPTTGGTRMSNDEQTAMTGSDPTTHQPVDKVNGRPLPHGGCNQQGVDAIGGPPPNIDDRALPDGGPHIPVSDPRVTDAYAKWSDCMRGKGYAYKDPIAAISDQAWGQEPNGASAKQIATATADIQCKVANNTVGVIVAVEIAYDKQYVDSHAQALTAYRQHIDDDLAKAATVVGRG